MVCASSVLIKSTSWYLNGRIEKKRSKRSMEIGGLKFATRLLWHQIFQMTKSLECIYAIIMETLSVCLVVVRSIDVDLLLWDFLAVF